MSTISYLQLDSQNDPSFANGTSLTNLAAVEQLILTRLNLFLGEWWENLNLGLPVFQSMLGQLGSQRTQTAISLAIQSNIAGGPYVTSVANVSTAFIDEKQFTFSADVYTAFGVVKLRNVPGLQAVVSS